VRCEEKHRLIEAYKSLVVNYGTAVNDLNLTRGRIYKVEYDRLLLSCSPTPDSSVPGIAGLARLIGKADRVPLQTRVSR
jgi:hypothetical protein